MIKKGYFILLLFFTLSSLVAQDCPDLLVPMPGATNVPVDTPITWENEVGVTGYIISIGTTPGGTDIINEQPVGSDTTFNPPFGLPESTTIYVTIILFFFDQNNIICPPKSFTTRDETEPPSCTTITNPQNGQTNVNINTNINWRYASKARGYRVSLGTTSGGTDIANNIDVGNVLFYNPPTNLPPETEIYVNIGPYNENGIALNCIEEVFTTASLGEPPGCTSLISPPNGAVNVSLSPLIEWEPVPGALGYKVFIGRSPFVNDVLDGAIFTNTSTFVLNFEPNNTYFVLIIPFNNAGDAQDCAQESFSTTVGCGPYFDPDTGVLISFIPESELPDTLGICQGNIPTQFTSPDSADGYRWFQVKANGDEILIGEERTVSLFEIGNYRYEIYNLIPSGDELLECTFTKPFMVEASSKAVIENVFRVQIGELFNITIQVSGLGDYEYALDDGPYTPDHFFLNLPIGRYQLKVRDKNGCGIAEKEIVIAEKDTGFPPYFSPNGDGINDYWTYIPPKKNALLISVIYIYNRHGKLLTTVNRFSKGWDGTYNGKALPSDGYWYKAATVDGKKFTGYFSLVR